MNSIHLFIKLKRATAKMQIVEHDSFILFSQTIVQSTHSDMYLNVCSCTAFMPCLNVCILKIVPKMKTNTYERILQISNCIKKVTESVNVPEELLRLATILL